MKSKSVLLLLAAASVTGLALVPLFLLSPNLQADPSPLRRPIVSAVYSVICVLGIMAVFYPGKCRLVFQEPKTSRNIDKQSLPPMEFRGHHPDCGQFSANRVIIKGKVFCAACSGLLVGAVVALLGIALFSWGVFGLAAVSLWVLAAGEVLMLIGLAQVKMSGYTKLAANTLFVVGSFFCLVAVDSAGQNLLVDVYVLGLTVYLLWFRILLSEMHNKQTCMVCGGCV